MHQPLVLAPDDRFARARMRAHANRNKQFPRRERMRDTTLPTEMREQTEVFDLLSPFYTTGPMCVVAVSAGLHVVVLLPVGLSVYIDQILASRCARRKRKRA